MSFEILPFAAADAVIKRASQWGAGAVLLPSPPVVDNDLPLLEQLLARAGEHGLEEPTDLCDFAVDALDAESLLPRVPRPMSRGERQICGILLAIAKPFDALFLLDPTAGLDMPRREAVRGLVLDCALEGEGTLVVAASDDPVLALQ